MNSVHQSAVGSVIRMGAKAPAAGWKSGRGDSIGEKAALWQVGLFALVGGANTVLDFAIYNILTSEWVGWQRIPANVVSTTVAMTFSFVVNLLWVFNPRRRLVPMRACRFLWVTSCALYGVQNLVIWLTSSVWSAPVDQLSAQVAPLLSLGAGSEDLIARNVVKGLATVGSLIWNYFWYRFYVFRNL